MTEEEKKAAVKEAKRKYRAEWRAKHPEAAEAQRKYIREWKRKNPDKVRAQIERYWERQGEKLLAELEEAERQRQTT